MKHIKRILTVISLASAAVVCFAACGDNGDENIPADHTHTFSSGWTYDESSHWHAASCDHTWLKDGEASHTFTDTKEGTETCDKGATVTRTCTCGYSYSYETDPLDHDWQLQNGQDATCTAPGFTAYYECSRCHAIRDKNEIQQTQHNYHYEIVTEDENGDPFVDEEGNEYTMHQLVCGICGDVQGDPVAHNFSETKYDEEGHWKVCVCGETTEKEDHVPDGTGGHDATGHWDGACSVCKAPLEKVEHTFEDKDGQEATCTEAGYTAYKECTECGYQDGKKEIPATGHTYVFDSDDTQHWRKCSVCNAEEPGSRVSHSYTYEHDAANHWQVCECGKTTDKQAHTPGTEITGKDGTGHWSTCSVCGEPGVKSEHSWQEVEKQDATCTQAGYTAYKVCKDCEYEEGKKVIPATGHAYIDQHDDQGHWKHCTNENCDGETDTEHVPHVYGGYLYDAEGHYQECACGYKTTKTNHTYNNNAYAHDATQHWLICDTCQAPSSTKANHDFGTTGVCVCGEASEIKDCLNYSADGATVLGLKEGTTDTVIVVPTMNNGKKVTTIAAGAFRGTAITRIVLPDTIRTIGDFAFENCAALKEINLPADLTKLGTFDYQVFNGCSKLESIIIPEGVTAIGQSMFANCKELATVTINSTLTEIDTQAFYGCTSLTALTVNGSLTYLGQKAFAKSGIQSLSISIAENGRIAQGAFEDCTALATLTISGGIKYFASPILAGCTGLEELTIPFVGNYNEAEKATDTHFGYIFGKDAEGYAIPETLTTVNITGGEVKRGAFDGCGALNVNAADDVDVETIDFEGYTGTFTWNGTFEAPELSDVTVEPNSIVAGQTVTLSYTADEYAKVTVSVKLGDAEAKQDDDYTVEGNTYTLKKAGAYTFTVTATANKKSTSATATVTVEAPGPNLGKITAEGEGYEGGRIAINKAVTLTFSYDGGDETTIAYTVKKGSETASATDDYTLVEDSKQITFKTAGIYTITVTATRNQKVQSEEIIITATDPDAQGPEITKFEASKTEGIIEGEDAITLTVEATPSGAGEELGTISYKVAYSATGTTSYENANASYYTLEGNAFRPLVAGNYQITAIVMGSFGGSTERELTLTVGKVDLAEAFELTAAATNGWVRVKSGADAQQISYTMNDLYLGGYDVTYPATNDVTTNGVEGEMAFTVKLDTPNTSVVTVTYTHKALADTTYTFEVPVSFVTDVDSAPVLGEDPFGGTYGKLIPGTGLMLYFDVTDKASANTQLANGEIAYEIVSKNINTEKNITIGKVNDDERYPFILVEDFDNGNHTTTGTVTVKLTATKGEQTAAATKVFTIETLPGRDSGDTNHGLNAYIDAAYPGTRGPMNLDIITEYGHRDNMVISKEGVFIHRAAADGWSPSGNMLALTWDGNTSEQAFPNDFKLEFDWTILKRTGGSNKAGFDLNLRTGSWNGYVGSQIGYYIENQDTQISCGYWGDGQNWEGRTLPDQSVIGQAIHVRMTHRLVTDQNKISYLVEWDVDGDDNDYQTWLTFSVDVSDAGMGAPIYAMQFNYSQGCYRLGNFRVTDLTNA